MIRFSEALLGAIAAGAAMTALGCSLLSVEYFSDQRGNGGGTTTTTATTGTGGAGGGSHCSPTIPCDDGNPCTKEDCTNGFCVPTPLKGTPCTSATNSSAKVCDEKSACVECAENDDCTEGMLPSCDVATHTCSSCSDTVKNGAETGADCGGGTCPKCDGDPCAAGTECKSSVCADNVCCNVACPGECVACDLPGITGTCTPVPAGLEASTCAGVKKACNGSGMCDSSAMGKAGTICSMDIKCYTVACNGMCRLPNAAPCVEDAECASLWCISNVCTACASNGDCASSLCFMGQCKVPAGGVCFDPTDCAGNACGPTNTCGKANGASCSGDADCVSYRCNSQKCGSCAAATQVTDCASHMCDANGNCLLPATAFCTVSAQCATNMCKGFPARCQ